MNGKTFAVFSSLLLLIGGATAWQMTGTLETNFDGLIEDAQDGEWQCVVMNSYYLPECTKPINIEVGGATTSEVKWSIANTASVATDNREQVLGATDKRLNASYGIAMAEAKAEAIEDLNAGSSEAIATSNASDVIRNWYSKIQRNTLNYRNRNLLKLNSSLNEIEKTSGLSVSDVFRVRQVTGDGDAQITSEIQPVDGLRVKETNRTLMNGETLEIYYAEAKVKVEASEDGSGCGSTSYGWKNVSQPSYDVTYHWGVPSCASDPFSVEGMDIIRVQNPDGGSSEFFKYSAYDRTLSSIKSTKDRAVGNTQSVVSNIFSTYSQGEVNVSSSLGPLEVLKTASTSYSSTGYYDYATLTAKQMGLETNDSYAFEINWSQEGSNETYKDVGQLFLDDTAFNGSLETGKQYNVTDQTVWFTRTASNGDIVQEELNGTFTILEMTDKESGETVNSTSTQGIQVYESDVTDLQNQLQTLQEQLEEYQQEQSGGSGGGGSMSGLFGLSAGQTGIVAVFLVMMTFIVGAVAT